MAEEDLTKVPSYMVTPEPVNPEIATTDKAGLVKPDGETILIDEDGTISADMAVSGAAATCKKLGLVKPDGTTCRIESDGTLVVMGMDLTTVPVNDVVTGTHSESYSVTSINKAYVALSATTSTVTSPINGTCTVAIWPATGANSCRMQIYVNGSAVKTWTGVTVSTGISNSTSVSQGDSVYVRISDYTANGACGPQYVTVSFSGTRVITDYCTWTPDRNFLGIGEVKRIGGSSPTASWTLDQTNGQQLLNVGVPSPGLMLGGIPDYSNPITQTIETSSTSPYSVTWTASDDGLVVFSGGIAAVSDYTVYLLLQVNGVSLETGLARAGTNRVTGFVKKGDKCSISTNVSEITNATITIYPFLASNYVNILGGVPDYTNPTALAVTQDTSNAMYYRATMPFDGFFVVQATRLNVSTAYVYSVSVDDKTIFSVPDNSANVSSRIISGFAKKDSTIKGGFNVNGYTNITMTAYPLITSAQNSSNLTIYTTDEQVVGQWIDGKTLYRKVIETISNSTTAQGIIVSITEEIYDTVVTLKGMYCYSDTAFIPCPTYFSSNNFLFISFQKGRGVNEYHADSTYNSLKMIIIMEYTKTSD